MAAVSSGDRATALALVSARGWSLGQLSDVLKADREVVLAAVKQNGRALEHAAAALRDDDEVVTAAVSQDGLALRLAQLDELFDQQRGRAADRFEFTFLNDPQ